jgi:GAF domain-containing protein
MHDHELLLRTLKEFAHALVQPYDATAILGELADRVTDVLYLHGTGISLASGSELRVHVAIPPEIKALESVENGRHRGPCVETFDTRQIVAVSDLESQRHRWPEFCAMAAEVGVRSVAGIPMTTEDECVGVLNMYARGPREWSSKDLAAATLMADMATGYLVNAAHLDREQRLNAQLQRALDSRVVIEQAKGVVAAMKGLSVEDAFEVIRAHARSNGEPLRQVAEAIVRGDLRV